MRFFKLQEDWKSAWKWLQVQLGILIAVAPEIYSQVALMQQFIPPQNFKYVMMGAGILVILNSVRAKQA